MRRVLETLLLASVLIASVIFIKKYDSWDNKIILNNNNNLEIDLKYKGLKNAVDFAVDEKENYYIAYKNKVQVIDKNGKSINLFKEDNLNIKSLEYYKNKLYFSSNTYVYSYDLHSKKFKEIIKDIPNFGDYRDSLIKINGDYLYVTIGAATNSGVVGDDNTWIKDNPFGHDISPYRITLKGVNYGNGNNGAFLNYNTKSIEGQIIPGHFPGNASIIMYNLENGNFGNYAWGLRNVKGIDFDSRGKMIVSVGGMEDRGLRPIKGDTDYIYEVKAKRWYGWPDYSGGDPVSSPKFKGKDGKRVSFVLDNHPTTNPEGPIYVHKNLGTLQSLAVDRNGKISEANTIYFYDNKEKVIYSLNNSGVLIKNLKFNAKSKISSIKYLKNQILLLDSNDGKLYSYGKAARNTNVVSKRPILLFLLITNVMIIVAIIFKEWSNVYANKNWKTIWKNH